MIFVKGRRTAFRKVPLRDQDGSAFEATCAQVTERGVCGIERIARDLHSDAGARRNFEKLVLLIVFVSLLPVIWTAAQGFLRRKPRLQAGD